MKICKNLTFFPTYIWFKKFKINAVGAFFFALLITKFYNHESFKKNILKGYFKTIIYIYYSAIYGELVFFTNHRAKL
ncbi:MAG: hypothetical protein CL605_06500 [Altibacter sp.]|nr:hypothetical protein [Altibacter sp.]